MSGGGEYLVSFRIDLLVVAPASPHLRRRPRRRQVGGLRETVESNAVAVWRDGPTSPPFPAWNAAPRRGELALHQQLLDQPVDRGHHRGRKRHQLLDRRQVLPRRQDLVDGRVALHHLVRRRQQWPLQHRHESLQRDPKRLPDGAGRRRLLLRRPVLRLRLSEPALHHLRLQRLLDGAGHRHRLQGRHAGPRDVALQRRRRHRRPCLRPDRLQESRDLAAESGGRTTPTATSTSPRTRRPSKAARAPGASGSRKGPARSTRVPGR